MEHRWYSREKSARYARLYYAGRSACRCRIDNVSPDGLYIKTPDIGLDHGSCVDVVIDGEGSGSDAPIRSKAVVVHRQGDGVGLMCLGVNSIYFMLTRGWRSVRNETVGIG